MFDKILPKGFLPKTFFRRIDGFYYDSDYRIIEKPADEYSNLAKEIDGFVIKPTIGTSSGNGVKICKKGEIPCFEELNSENNGDFIIQELLHQHEGLSFFNPTSINTLRMLVYRSPIDGCTYMLNCALRVGKKGSRLDNAHAGGVLIGVNDNGQICDFAVDQYGKKYKQVNDIVLADGNYDIPEFEKIKEFACNVAQNVTHHRLLAMDVAVCEGEEGKVRPVCVEYNISSLGTWAFQYTVKPVFGNKTDEIIDYCKSHKKEAVKFFGVRN